MRAFCLPKQLVLALGLSVSFSAIESAPAKAAEAAADPAVVQIQSFYATLLDGMKHAQQLGVEGRYNKLKPVIEAVFNLPAMTAFAVGPKWSSFSEAEHKALTDAFERMTIASYAKNFAGYSNQQFVVDPKTNDRPPDRLVNSELRMTSGEPVKFIYRMRQTDGSWKVIDVFLAGFTSQLALRRSEFASTVDAQGVDGLVKKMNAVTDGLMKS